MRTRAATNEPDLPVIVCAAFMLTASMTVAWILPRVPLQSGRAVIEVGKGEPTLQRVQLAWLPSFGDLVDVQIDAQGGQGVLVAEEWSQRHWRPLALKRRVERILSFDEWQEIQRELWLADFWALRPHLEIPMLDGAIAVVEASTSERRHRVECWNCSELHPLRRLLLRLSTLDPAPRFKREQSD